jgi:simple sugar transport system ATP-binding protein
MNCAPRLELTGVTKRHGDVLANDGVSLTVQPGEIHAVLGENGAGKSTLMKIIYGAVQPDAGVMRFDGVPVTIRHPRAAQALGISMVFQHFSLFDSLTVAENIWLGLRQSEPLAQVRQRIAAKAVEYGLELDPARPVHTLSAGEMQRVEIVRALLANPRLLILDEPTSVLTPQAAQRLFVTLHQLAAQGCSVLYISHKLHEIRALCSACTVLRAGRVTGTCDPRTQTDAALARMMMGVHSLSSWGEGQGEGGEQTPRFITGQRPHPNPLPHAGEGAPILEVQQLDLPCAAPFGVDLHDVSLRVCAGEVVGIAGVSGNGQRELLLALSGEDRRATPRAIAIGGVPAGRLTPQRRRALGLHLAPEERLGRGAVAQMSLAHNLLLTRREAVGALGWLRMGALRRQAVDLIGRFGVKAAGPDAPARSLSGGNLQKYIMGREIDAAPRLLIAAQPTASLDSGAAAQIRAELLALREAGCAVLVVSEELDELLDICDRLHVMAKGQLSPSMARQHATVERIGQWMSGLWPRHSHGMNQEAADASS